MGDLFHERISEYYIEKALRAISNNQRHQYFVLTKRPERMAHRFFFHSKNDFHKLYHHVWWGITAENQTRLDERLPYLIQVPSRRLFVSAEPLLGPLSFPETIPWIIVGGESGHGCRKMDLKWARAIRDRCKESGAAFYFKQIGGFPNPKHRKEALLDGKLYKELPRGNDDVEGPH